MKLALLTDTDMKGSGYFNIAIPLCSELAKRGHSIKIAGYQYAGEEHYYDFSIIPATNIGEAMAILQNLYNFWGFDALIVAMDIPVQEGIIGKMQNRPFKYVGIMPVEAEPLCLTFAQSLMRMDHVFIISNFGTKEAEKVGVTAEHLVIGIDTNSWRLPTSEEKQKLRKSFGFEDDEFVILTVADNQERKNLSLAMRMTKEFSDKYGVKFRHILVTRKQLYVGWKLDDLAQEFKMLNNVMIFERGIPFKELWSIYAVSDTFLLTSKAEGLSIPLLEAMSVGIPTLVTDCTGMKELTSEGRGNTIDIEYGKYRDPFGNGYRYFPSLDDGIEKLYRIYSDKDMVAEQVKKAREYMETRTWENTANQVEKTIEKLLSKDKKNENTV